MGYGFEAPYIPGQGDKSFVPPLPTEHDPDATGDLMAQVAGETEPNADDNKQDDPLRAARNAATKGQ